MYNGIGINSTRGTGTSGHVQRNFAALRYRTNRRPVHVNKPAAPPSRALAPGLVAHERRRAVEVAVAELHDELIARQYEQATIIFMKDRLRKDLLSRDAQENLLAQQHPHAPSHNLMQSRNERLRTALNLNEDYNQGDAFRAKDKPANQIVRPTSQKSSPPHHSDHRLTSDETWSPSPQSGSHPSLNNTSSENTSPRHASPRDTSPKHASLRHASLRHASPKYASPWHGSPRGETHAFPRQASPIPAPPSPSSSPSALSVSPPAPAHIAARQSPPPFIQTIISHPQSPHSVRALRTSKSPRSCASRSSLASKSALQHPPSHSPAVKGKSEPPVWPNSSRFRDPSPSISPPPSNRRRSSRYYSPPSRSILSSPSTPSPSPPHYRSRARRHYRSDSLDSPNRSRAPSPRHYRAQGKYGRATRAEYSRSPSPNCRRSRYSRSRRYESVSPPPRHLDEGRRRYRPVSRSPAYYPSRSRSRSPRRTITKFRHSSRTPSPRGHTRPTERHTNKRRYRERNNSPYSGDRGTKRQRRSDFVSPSRYDLEDEPRHKYYAHDPCEGYGGSAGYGGSDRAVKPGSPRR